MGRNKNIIEQIKEQKLLPLFYHPDPAICKGTVQALYDAGIRIVEFTNRGNEALDNFKLLLKERDKLWPDLLLSVGTIKNEKDAKAYIKAGTDFIICPGVVKEVAERTHASKLIWIPGCMTTTEIMLAESCRAKLVKIFPGNLLGPDFIRSIKDLFPGMDFMPTGGVEINKTNIENWFDAGVCAVGMGSKLISKTILEKKDYGKITTLTKQALDIIHSITN